MHRAFFGAYVERIMISDTALPSNVHSGYAGGFPYKIKAASPAAFLLTIAYQMLTTVV